MRNPGVRGASAISNGGICGMLAKAKPCSGWRKSSMNARGRTPPLSTYITVTAIHAPRLSADKLAAGQVGAPNAIAVRHAPPRPPKPSAIGYKRKHPARPAITEVDIRLSAGAAVVLRMLVGTVLLSGGAVEGWHRCRGTVEVHTTTIIAA